MYALFKQGTQDPPIDKADTPGMFDLKVRFPCYRYTSQVPLHIILILCDLQGKAKKRAWQAVVDKGTTPSAAQKDYVELVEKLKSSYGYDATKPDEPVGTS